MMKLVTFLQKRPKDGTIRATRALYAVALASFLVLAWADYSLPFASALGEPNATYAEYALAALVLVPGFAAAFGCCVAKKKHVRLMQIAGSVFLFVLSASISQPETENVSAPAVASTGSISASSLAGAAETPSDWRVDVSFWLAWLAVLPLLSGITGKMVTEKCLKYGEVIKKIRV